MKYKLSELLIDVAVAPDPSIVCHFCFSAAYINSPHGWQFTVLTDRSRGVASLREGSIEVMVHRCAFILFRVAHCVVFVVSSSFALCAHTSQAIVQLCEIHHAES